MSTQPLVTLIHVVGARPNFMKAAAVLRAVERWNEDPAAPVRFCQVLVHTGQHYDEQMSQIFFADLGLPRPRHDLGVGSGSHAQQTARVMLALEPVLEEERPDLVVTVGDVNSTLAAALTAVKLGIPVAHVEAGLRSHDWSMPEEINRVLTDRVSELLFTTSREAETNLISEGIPQERIYFVGNTMIDTLERYLPQALQTQTLRHFGLSPQTYAVVTLHRPSNVDEQPGLERLARFLTGLGQRLPVIFPIHARTRKRLAECGLETRLEKAAGLVLTEPLGYLDFLGILAQARIVLTDSGGIQEETTVLGVPCLTLRKNTERPVTLSEGTNRLVDPEDESAMLQAAEQVLAAPMPDKRRPALWDGRAGERIVKVIAEWSTRNNPQTKQ